MVVQLEYMDMGEEKISVGHSPVLDLKHFLISKAFNLETGQWIARIRIRDDYGKELAVILNHEAYHTLTKFISENDNDLYNHSDRD